MPFTDLLLHLDTHADPASHPAIKGTPAAQDPATSFEKGRRASASASAD